MKSALTPPKKNADFDRLYTDLDEIETEYRSLERTMAEVEKRKIVDLRDSGNIRKKPAADRKPADRKTKASEPPKEEPVAQNASSANNAQAAVAPAAQNREVRSEKTGSSQQDFHTVKGRIVDINGNPQSDIEIAIGEKYFGESGENGEYSIERVPEGNYSLSASNGDHGPVELPLSVDGGPVIVEDIIYPEAVRQFIICKHLDIHKNENNRTVWTIEGAGEEFEGGVGSLTCLTRIVGAKQRLTVKHRWFCNDEFISEVPLEIKSPNWRTYSVKSIHKAGPWRIDVVRVKDGKLLASKSFSVN